MNGAEYVAAFLADRGVARVHLMTGGACAFMVDAVARNPALDYVCFQHEQAAAMAADAVWRVGGGVGVTMATSGPGATNLLTGIACSYFDSIPTVHITGQVNQRESAVYLGAKVRQYGFQETDIVAMACPITKHAVQTRTIDELKIELNRAWNIALSGRMGPVLIDVPMNVQQEDAGDEVIFDPDLGREDAPSPPIADVAGQLETFFAGGERPLVLFGAGVGLSGAGPVVEAWLTRHGTPFVASWNGMTWFDHRTPGYCGQIGVYGNRGANSIVQNCDRLLVLGSRLDNRQRSGAADSFAPAARVHVIDIDGEELKKYDPDRYTTTRMDLAALSKLLSRVAAPGGSPAWRDYVSRMKTRWSDRDVSRFAAEHASLSPYAAIRRINELIDDDAIVPVDTGAALCWVFQTFRRTRQTIFTAGGNSPMGYALCAAIGAALEKPDRPVVCFTGDGGFQVNIQELQTIRQYGLDVVIVVLNNGGYGIIKQFQDSYLGGRHEASGRGYGAPDFGALARAYGMAYRSVETLDDITPEMFRRGESAVVDVLLHPGTLIEPKLEMGRPINDQFPYMSDEDFAEANPFVTFSRRR